MTAILFSLVTFVSTLSGGLFSIKYRDKIHLIISFTAGVLIAVSFFDVIQEIFSIAQENHFDLQPALIMIVAGFLAIHILEKTALIHHSHETQYAEHKHPMVGYIGASGLAFHSFLDGVGIGLGFQVSPHIGFLIAFAVIAHDFSDGLNTVSVMLLNRHTVKKALVLLSLDAITPILGVLTTYLFHIPEMWLMLYLGFFAGFLLYIGASDLLPEAHSNKSSYGLIGLTALGIVFIFIVTRFA